MVAYNRRFSKSKTSNGAWGKKNLKKLAEYASDNQIDLYLDGITDYAYDSNLFDGFWVFTDSARFVSKDKAEIYPYSTVTYAKKREAEAALSAESIAGIPNG